MIFLYPVINSALLITPSLLVSSYWNVNYKSSISFEEVICEIIYYTIAVRNSLVA